MTVAGDGRLEGTSVRVVREDDPETVVLRDAGWVVVAESWGARLHLPDEPTAAALAPLVSAVERAVATGWQVVQLGPADAADIVALDATCAPDYPWTPATGHDVPAVDDLAASLDAAWWAFGARSGRGDLAAVTVLSPLPNRAETEFTATRAGARRQGLASAVKAASVLHLVGLGYRTFGTGGAASNEGSLRANRRLGYVLEPRWLTWRAPGPPAPAPARDARGS